MKTDTEQNEWAAHKEESKRKRWANAKSSLMILRSKGFEPQALNLANAHYRINGFDYWPTTGKYHNLKSGKKGRGVFNLLKELSHG